MVDATLSDLGHIPSSWALVLNTGSIPALHPEVRAVELARDHNIKREYLPNVILVTVLKTLWVFEWLR